MLQIGMKYRFSWRIEDGTQYERGVVVAQEGTAVQVKLDAGQESAINMATPNFIRADLQP
jgi:hypothetical protein